MHVSLVGVANCVGGPGVHSISIYLAYKTLGDVPDATGRLRIYIPPFWAKKPNVYIYEIPEYAVSIQYSKVSSL